MRFLNNPAFILSPWSRLKFVAFLKDGEEVCELQPEDTSHRLEGIDPADFLGGGYVERSDAGISVWFRSMGWRDRMGRDRPEDPKEADRILKSIEKEVSRALSTG